MLPIELRTLDIAEKDSMEIYIEGDAIILRKYQPACIFCDSAKDIVSYRGKNVCLIASVCLRRRSKTACAQRKRQGLRAR